MVSIPLFCPPAATEISLCWQKLFIVFVPALLATQHPLWLLVHSACISDFCVHSRVPTPNYFLCPHLCSCHAPLCVGACVYVWVGRSEVNLCRHSLGVLHLVFGTGSPTASELQGFTWPPTASTLGLQACATWLAFSRGPGVEFRTSCLQGKLTKPSTQPPFLILKMWMTLLK